MSGAAPMTPAQAQLADDLAREAGARVRRALADLCQITTHPAQDFQICMQGCAVALGAAAGASDMLTRGACGDLPSRAALEAAQAYLAEILAPLMAAADATPDGEGDQ